MRRGAIYSCYAYLDILDIADIISDDDEIKQ